MVEAAALSGGGCSPEWWRLRNVAHTSCKVIAITRSAARRTKATELGADVVIDATDATAVAAAVRAATGGAGCDVIFECAARPPTAAAPRER